MKDRAVGSSLLDLQPLSLFSSITTSTEPRLMATNNPALVSIITPSYNQARWLPDNLKSVQNQDYPNIEHIIMDGGSTDGSTLILQQAPSNTRWESEPDRGQSHAINKAFEKANGEYVGWINSDDAYADRRTVSAVVKTFEAHPEVGVVYGHGIVLSQTNRFMHGLWAPEYNEKLLRMGVLLLQPSVFFRRSILTSPLVSEALSFVMDWDLFLRLSDQGVLFKRVPLITGVDRHQANRKTLQGGPFEDEMTSFQRSFGVERNSWPVRWQRKATTVVKRLMGVPLVVRLPEMIDPAIDIEFGTLSRRLINQTLLHRRAIDAR